MIDIRQTPQYAKYLRQVGWEVERLAETNYFIKKVPLLGSVLKLQRPEEIKINKIKDLVKSRRVFQLIIEPRSELDAIFLKSVGYKLSKSPYLPTKTLQLDLTKSEKNIFANLKKDARYAIRKKSELRIANYTDNIEEFRNAWKNSVGLKRHVPPLTHLSALKNSFKEDCAFFACFDGSNQQNKICGGAIFLKADKIAYYWQAFTNNEGRKRFAQYQIVWQGIGWAKKSGGRIFDFEGIFDERFPNKSWQGFSHFKKSFGGYEVTYPGCMIKTRISL